MDKTELLKTIKLYAEMPFVTVLTENSTIHDVNAARGLAYANYMHLNVALRQLAVMMNEETGG